MENYFNKKNMQDNNYIDVELDEDEIQNLIAQGYMVEELPKAQEGYINFTPYSNRGDMPGVETFGSKNPTMNIGYTRDITGRLVKNQGFEKAIGNITAKLPYSNNTGVGIQGGLKLVGDRIKAIQDVTKANVETDFIAGYDPKLGFHSSLIASPQFTFGNVQPTMSKVYGTGLKSGEWLAKAGPYAGVSAIPGRDLREERFSIPAGVKANVDFGLGRKGIKAGLSGYFGVDAFGQAGSNATNATDAGQTQGRTHYGLEAGLKIPLNLPVNWAKKLIAEKEKEDDYYTPRLQQGGVNNNYIDIDADDDDIANYIAQGYQVEELSKAQFGYAKSPVQLTPYYSFDQPESPEAWTSEIKNLERQIGNPSQWGMEDHSLIQNKLNDYKAWRAQHPEVRDSSNKPNEYVVPLPYHLKKTGGNVVKKLSKYQLAGAVQNDSGYRTSTEALQGLIKQRDSDLSYAKTPAQKAQVNKQYDKLIADATSRQNMSYNTANTAGTKQVKNIINTSNEAAKIKADKLAKEKAEARYYAAELAKNKGKVPDSKYAYLDERAAPVADNTRVDPSYLPFAQQEIKFANQAQNEEERKQEDDYRTQLALTKDAQKQGYKNIYDQKYNPKPVVPTWTERNKLGYDDPNANMHSGAAGSADWFWTLPLAIPAAIEGLGALAGTTLGSAAEAAFAIDGANMIYEGRNALEIANAMPENTYEQKIAKLDAQNEAYGSMSLGALDALPFGIRGLKGSKSLSNVDDAYTFAKNPVTINKNLTGKTPLELPIGERPFGYGNQDVYNNMIKEFDKANGPVEGLGKITEGTNILPSKDPGFISELNAAKFKMQSGLDSPVGPQIGPLANKWRDIDKVDLDVPSIEELQNFGLDESALAFPANVSNETILSSQQRAMIKNIEGAKQTALSKGDTELAKQFDTYISKIKNDELKKFTETPYTGEEAMSSTTLNYSGNEIPDTNNLFDETDKDLALHFLKEKNKEDVMGHSTTEMHFNDWKNQKLLDLETLEGQRRIEKFLNDNPSKVNVNDFMDKFKNLKYYNVTKPMQKDILNNVDKINDVTDKITKLTKDRDQYYDIINEDNWTLYNKEIERLDAEITMLENDKDGLMSDTEGIIKLIDQKNKDAFYESGNNSIFIGEEYQTSQELPRVIGHEGSHPLTARLLGQTSFNSKMDQDLIKELKLTKKIPKHLEKKLSAEEIRNTPSGVSQKGAIDKARDTKKYWEEAKEYWESGKFKKGQSNEPTSFIAEVRTAMKEDGIIKNDYDPITEDMLKAYYEDYIKKPLHHSSLRVFDIMKNDASNFKVLKKHINNLLSLAPYLIPAGIGVGAAAASGEDNTPQYKYGGNVNKLQKFIK